MAEVMEELKAVEVQVPLCISALTVWPVSWQPWLCPMRAHWVMGFAGPGCALGWPWHLLGPILALPAPWAGLGTDRAPPWP